MASQFPSTTTVPKLSFTPDGFYCDVEYSSVLSRAARSSACARGGRLRSWTSRNDLRCLLDLGRQLGVIVFVLMCEKILFDDEYIPNLFKKISRLSLARLVPSNLLPPSLLTLDPGSKYLMPIHLSADAKDLICQLLVVNPDQSATIAGMGNHQWLEENLPKYLQTAKEERLDTEQV